MPKHRYYFDIEQKKHDKDYLKRLETFLKRVRPHPGGDADGLLNPSSSDMTADGNWRFYFKTDHRRACVEEIATTEYALAVPGGNTRKTAQQIIDSLPPST